MHLTAPACYPVVTPFAPRAYPLKQLLENSLALLPARCLCVVVGCLFPMS
jgi:hypothetical protein